ncbi:hypothetical protein M407DRAFT_242816 [Tulasnella calospora MUT 4182]|uniref:Isomerase YbhE n=1 Tax=Tulasnella calospora MUT 4182 TaxID=1051891 RepID=A0A0C3M5G1_9AGAM|nr:hypothetical protein M407DRAFT_242816 [Tulasnella calospora MUT 4182]
MVHTIYVGSYTNLITTLSFDPSTGSLQVTGTTEAGPNPSWVATHPTDKSLLFASNEVGEGKIVLFKRSEDGKLQLLQSVWSGGAGTAHFAVGEKEVVAANYSSGTLLTIPLQLSPPALLAPPNQPVKFDFPGTGPDADRQEASHPHQVAFHPSGKELLIPDLGSDKVWTLGRNAETQSWEVKGELKTKPGHGPRHLIVKGETVYVLNELESTMSTYPLPAAGAKESACLSLLTPPTQPAKGMLGAEVLLTESTPAFPEALIYASNRNDPHAEGDSIAIFTTADCAAGFSLVKEVRTGLNHLRAVTFGGEEDKYLVVGGLNGGGIKVFERTEGGKDLKEVAHLAAGVDKPTSFVVY